jgi:hypothetical protein
MPEEFERSEAREGSTGQSQGLSDFVASEVYSPKCALDNGDTVPTQGTPSDNPNPNMSGEPDMSQFQQLGPGDSGPEPGTMTDTLPPVELYDSSKDNKKAEASEEIPPCHTS